MGGEGKSEWKIRRKRNELGKEPKFLTWTARWPGAPGTEAGRTAWHTGFCNRPSNRMGGGRGLLV